MFRANDTRDGASGAGGHGGRGALCRLGAMTPFTEHTLFFEI
jgi:hypothetical protein